MSNIYIQEPPTSGKVILNTTVGEIEIELWSKEAPKACRNFVQLVMEGYYNDTIFHRVVKGFIIQGGDPTGTGEGGESIYGAPFKDEFHSRLRFVRRGLVAMANSAKNDNASQFFFTLDEAMELQNKHTIFGKVVGDTMFNMLRLAEVELDSNERPTYPHKIKKGKVVSNPFLDIVPRVSEKKKSEKSEKKKSTAKAKKDFKLLSFGEEAEEDEGQTDQVSEELKSKSKSSHDLLEDATLSKVPVVQDLPDDPNETRVKKGKYFDDSSDEEYSDEEETEKQQEKRREKEEKVSEVREKLRQKNKGKSSVDEPKVEEDPDAKLTRLERLKKEAKKLKRELKEKELGKTDNMEDKTEVTDRLSELEKTNDMIRALKEEKMKYEESKTKKVTKSSNREKDTLALLEKFNSKLFAAPKVEELSDDKNEHAVSIDADDDLDPSDSSWMTHKLEVMSESRKRRVIDANVAELDRYEIFDPRNPLTKRRREQAKAGTHENYHKHKKVI